MLYAKHILYTSEFLNFIHVSNYLATVGSKHLQFYCLLNYEYRRMIWFI